MDVKEIERILPHRYPFLLVDKVLEIEDEKRIVAQKNVTANEYFFPGHFPGYPVMPGVLIVEAMAQTGAILLLCKPEFKGKIVLFAGIDHVRFRKQVLPGDVLRMEVEMIDLRGLLGKAKAVATVDGQTVCEGEMTFAIKKD